MIPDVTHYWYMLVYFYAKKAINLVEDNLKNTEHSVVRG